MRLTLLVLLPGLAAAQTFTLKGPVELIPVQAVAPHYPGDKPSWSMPAHPAASVNTMGTLNVIEIEAWKKHFAASPDVARTCVTKPLAALSRSLTAKTITADAIPGCEDAHAAFILWSKKISFSGGTGWLFLTQWMIEDVMPSNRAMTLEFHGLTTDGRTYVNFSIPARAEGFSDDEGALEFDAKKQRARVSARIAQLEKLGVTSVTPTFSDIESTLNTLQVTSKPR